MTTLQMWILVGTILLTRGLNETAAFFLGAVVLIVCLVVALLS